MKTLDVCPDIHMQGEYSGRHLANNPICDEYDLCSGYSYALDIWLKSRI